MPCLTAGHDGTLDPSPAPRGAGQNEAQSASDSDPLAVRAFWPSRTTSLQQCGKLTASRGFVMQLYQMARFGDEPGEGSPRQRRKGAPCRSGGAIQIGRDEGRILWLVMTGTACDQVQQCLLALLGYRAIGSYNFHKHDKDLAGPPWWGSRSTADKYPATGARSIQRGSCSACSSAHRQTVRPLLALSLIQATRGSPR